MKTDKYKKLLSRCPALLYAAEKAAAENNDALAQVTAYVTAPVLFCYVRFILESAAEHNIHRIYFLSRDGYILKQIADVIAERENLPVKTSYLYVSRYSLRNALYYKCESAEDFERAGFFGHCAVQSAENTLKRAGLNESQRLEVYKNISFSGDEKRIMSDREYNDFCNELKKDKVVFESIKKQAEEKYRNIILYFEQSGLLDNEKKALVDSGWLGSVQRTLTELVSDKTDVNNIVGFYFGLYRKKDDSYRAFLFDISDAHKYVPTFCNNLFECFCSAPHGMTTGYELSGDKAVPIMAATDPQLAKAADMQIKTAVRFTQYVCEKHNEISKEMLRTISCRLIKQLMYKPDKQEAKILGEFPFCDDVTEIRTQPLACDCGGSIKNILFINRIFRKRKGLSIYPESGMYWLYGSIVLTGCKPAQVYRISVRLWEKLRLIKEKRKLCR